jgi:very-short-patch-repair endonuclease
MKTTSPKDLISGQKVGPEKLKRAKELRKNMTPEEKTLWQILCANRFHGYHFRRQQIIQGFIVDFYCHSSGPVIEVDGPIHKKHRKEDTERDKALHSLGLKVPRIQNEEIKSSLERVKERILACLSTNPFPSGKGRRG